MPTVKGRKLKVLIVEDDVDVRQIYELALKADGRFEVRGTHDGGHAAALLRTESFDACVLDVKLPTMNGLQVAAVARASQLNRRIPLVVVSGVIDDDGLERARSFNVFKVLTKPVTSEALTVALGSALALDRKAPGYDVRILNSVIKAATEVLEFYQGGPVEVARPGIRQPPIMRRRGITGSISLSGDTFAGSLAVVADFDFAKAIAGKILAGAVVEPDEAMLVDVMGELCNQMCGRLKAVFSQLGIKSHLGLPEVVIGDDHVLVHKPKSPVIFVPLKVAGVGCEVEYCMVESSGFAIDEDKGEEAAEGVLLFE